MHYLNTSCFCIFFKAASPKWQSKNELQWASDSAKTLQWGFQMLVTLQNVSLTVNRFWKEGNKMRRGREKVRMVTGLGGGYLCWGELFWTCSVTAGCWSGRTLAGDIKSLSGPFCSLTAARIQSCFITVSAAQNAFLSCTDVWNLASHPIPSLSGLLHGICCLSALRLGWPGRWAFLLWHGSVHSILLASSNADQQLRRWAENKSGCPWSVALPRSSPAFVSAAQAGKFFGQRLISITFVQCCVTGGLSLVSTCGGPLWILIVPKGCSDRSLH